MKYTYSEYRQKAWESLDGKVWKAICLLLVYYAIAFVISALSGSGSNYASISSLLADSDHTSMVDISSNTMSWRSLFGILNIFLIPMVFIMSMAFLEIAKGNDCPKVSFLFEPYKNIRTAVRYFVIILLKGLFIFLWTLLLIIPGLIKAYSYSMAEYIAYEHPELTPAQAIRKSEEMMRGHKWELFVLDLTFIGWFLLSILTCGLLFLFVGPYLQTTHAHFYLSLKEDTVAESTLLQ